MHLFRLWLQVEDSTTFYYCVNHSGMGNSIQTTQYETIVLNSGSNILFDATQHGFNIATIKLEAGTQGRKDTDSIVFEDTGRPILLEESIIGTLQDVGDKLLIDRYQEENTGNFFIDLETETGVHLVVDLQLKILEID